MYDMLFSPMNIGTMTVKNRIVMTAAEFSLGDYTGEPTERMIAYYEARAKGGVGLIIPGICRVNDMGACSTFTQLSMASNRHIVPMRRMADRIHAAGAKLCIQLHHPGRQGYASSINSLPLVKPVADRFPGVMDVLFKCTPVLLGLEQKRICMSVQAPSKVEPAQHGATRMHAMSHGEVTRLRDDFIAAAKRCKLAGVDAVELHCTHGYILQQFLSPLTNRRTDEYGGSFDNRMRFITEIIEGIKSTCGKNYPLIVRLSVDEMYDRIGRPGDGYGLETGLKIAKRLEQLGVDAINVSSACYDAYNYWLEPTSFDTGWRAYLAKAVKEVVNIPVIAASFIREPEQADRLIEEGYQDFIGSARAFICDPEWAVKAKEGRTDEIRRCIGCLHCIKSFIANACVGKPGECALNPTVGYEREFSDIPDVGQGRTAVVAGAGVAGLEAAVTLVQRGFKVTVFEKNDRPGGQVIAAAAGPHKAKLYWCIEDLAGRAERLGVNIEYGTEADAAKIAALHPAIVMVASGSVPVRPHSISGIDNKNVITAPDVLLGAKELPGSTAVVVGSGLTGLETAEALCGMGKQVTIVEMADEIAPGAWFQFVDDSMSRLAPAGVKVLTGTRLECIGDGFVTVSDQEGTKKLPADSVVLAMGVRPVNSLVKELEAAGIRAVAVGDASLGGNIAHAVHSAFEAAVRSE